MRRALVWKTAAGIAAFLAILCTQALAAGPQKITSIEGITEYRLDNKLRVLLFPDPSKETVTVNMTVFVGSRHEGYGEAGMAHLLEHMLFKGTPTHPNIPDVLKQRGAVYNGTTWVDRTNYYETLPAGDENLEFAIRMEADRLVNSYVRAEDLASEMTVVRNEFERGENSPSSVLIQRILSVAYEWHNYGKATIGNRADIERVPIENLRRFYRWHYQPDNAMVVVAGQFEPERALEYFEKYFGPLPSPERALDQTYTEEPPQDGERIVTLRRVGDVAVVGACYHVPAGSHEDFASVEVLEGILTAEPSGRLYKALVETKRASDVSGIAFSWHDPSVLLTLAEVAKGNAPETVLNSMLDVVEDLGETGVSEEDVSRIKQRLLKERELAAADSGRIAIELSEWAAMGDWRLYFLHRDRIEQVTPESVQRAAQQYLKRSNRTVGLYMPTEAPDRIEVPQTTNLAETIGDYQGREQIAVGEAFDPSPENIESRTVRGTLPSGIRIALLDKRTRGRSVNLQLTLRYGNQTNLQHLATACEMLPVLMSRGTRQLTRQQLRDRLDQYRARLRASGEPGELSFSIETKREFLADVLELLRQILREPTLPAEELEILKQEWLSEYERMLTDPQALATTTVRRRLSPYPSGDPRAALTVEQNIDELNAVTIETIQRLYGSYLGGQHGELAIVGDFDPDEVRKQLVPMFADWNAAEAYHRLELTGRVPDVGGSEVILTPDKANATYFAACVFPLRNDHPDYPSLVLGDFILGGGGLSSRLAERVRQREGLSYGVGSRLNASSVDDRAVLSLYAICNPANIDRVKTAIREELGRLLADGVTSDELEGAKNGYTQRQRVRRADDGNLAGILAGTLHAGRTMQYYVDLDQSIQSAGPDQIVEVLRKHVLPEELFAVTAGDFAGNGADAGK